MKERHHEQESLEDLKSQILSLNRLVEGFSQSLTEEMIYSKKKTEKALENALNENLILGKRLSEVESFIKKHYVQDRIPSQNDLILKEDNLDKFEEGIESEYKDRRRAVSQDSIEKVPSKNNHVEFETDTNVHSSRLDDMGEDNSNEVKSQKYGKRIKTLSENASPTHLISKTLRIIFYNFPLYS